MRKLFLSVLSIILLIAVAACDRDNRKAKNYNDKTLADYDAITLMRMGIAGSIMEIRAAEIAKSRSSNPRVISFAKMMISDHSKVVNELKKIQADKLVNSRDGLLPEQKQHLADLSAKSGTELDKAYMEMMVEDHEKDIELFENVTDNTNATIQHFAEKTLPTLKMHLDSAKAINASLK
jgi:putative membrane protein